MRRWPVKAGLGVLAIAGASVGVHDSYCHYVNFDSSPLCQRSDGSLWRDPSNGCLGHEDPACRDDSCPDSNKVNEGWRHTCSWLFLRSEVGPTGPPPHYEGHSPRGGLPGRI